jgi:hypothetical protein
MTTRLRLSRVCLIALVLALAAAPPVVGDEQDGERQAAGAEPADSQEVGGDAPELSSQSPPVSYTHLTLPTTPYV